MSGIRDALRRAGAGTRRLFALHHRLPALLALGAVLTVLWVALRPYLHAAPAVSNAVGGGTFAELQRLEERVHRAPADPEAHLELAMFYGQNRAYLDAVAEFEAARKLGTRRTEIDHHLASAYQMLGQFDLAIRHRRESIRRSPQRLLYRLALAQTYVEAGRVDLARKTLDAIPTELTVPSRPLQPGSEAAVACAKDLGLLASTYSTCGDNTRALELLEKGVALEGGDAALWALLGRTFILLGKPERAAGPLEQSVRLVGDRPELHYLLGAAYLQQNRPALLDKAQASFEAALRLAPGDARSYFHLGRVMEEKGRWRDAANAYGRAYENEFATVPVLNALSNALRRAGEPLKGAYHAGLAHEAADRLPAALKEFQRLTTSKATAVSAFVKMADIYGKMKNFRAQVASLQKALALVPGDVDLIRRLAVANLQSGNLSRFEQLMNEAAEREPGLADLSWREMGAAYLSRGRLDDAEACFKRCVDLQPTNSAYLYALGKSYLDRMNEGDRKQLAVRHLEEAVRHAPGGDIALQCNYHLGIAYQRLERWDDAAAAFRRVINLDPGYGEAYLNLGQIYRKLGRHDQARFMFDLSRRYRQFIARKELLETRQKARKQDPEANYRLGLFYVEAGARQEALPYLERTVALNPRHVEAHGRLAVIYGLEARREDEERAVRTVRQLKARRGPGG